jgi:hypothetical protein
MFRWFAMPSATGTTVGVAFKGALGWASAGMPACHFGAPTSSSLNLNTPLWCGHNTYWSAFNTPTTLEAKPPFTRMLFQRHRRGCDEEGTTLSSSFETTSSFVPLLPEVVAV